MADSSLVILSAAPFVILSAATFVILSEATFVILSEAKDLKRPTVGDSSRLRRSE